jgi:hypothetical protein
MLFYIFITCIYKILEPHTHLKLEISFAVCKDAIDPKWSQTSGVSVH